MLLNYTTKVDAFKTISEISQLLAKAGASAIMHDFDQNGFIVALSFKIKLGDQEIAFRLPTDWHPVLAVLQEQRVPRSLQTQEQALRVAWRITLRWIEAQVAFIETAMVTTAQVFLPYAITADGRSLYEYIAENTNLLLGDGK
jgi:predicted sugar kinase